MRAEELASLTSGVLGRFWTIDAEPSEPLHDDAAVSGQLQLVAGVVQVKTQLPTASSLADLHGVFTGLAGGVAPATRWLFGITEIGTVLVPVVTGDGVNQQLSGNRVSTHTYRGPSVAVSVGEDATGPRVTRLAVDLPFARWAELDPLTKTGHFDSEQRWQGLDITLRGTETVDCGPVNDIKVSLRGTWSETKTDQDHVTSVATGLQVITESETPHEHDDHVEIVMGVQDLVSLAYDRFLPAQRAQVVFEGAVTDRGPTWFYHRSLVEEAVPNRNEPADQQSKSPMFKLKDLGGAPAVARWVALNQQYPDAANAIRVRYRTPTNPTRRIIELGAAIEQYVATVKGEVRAAGEGLSWPSKSTTYEGALALHAGAEFGSFVEDAEAWGEVFHEAYVNEKHRSGPRRPAAELARLSFSAQILLTAVLLNRAAADQRPSEVLLADHRIDRIGDVVREIVRQSDHFDRRHPHTPAGTDGETIPEATADDGD